MSKKFFKKSKWFHKYFGLFGIIFLIEMSISGIILNHKEVVAPFDMPHFLTPSNYDIKNFNRSAIIDFLETDNYFYIAGKKGVYRAEKANEPEFKPLFNGLSKYTLKRKSYDLQKARNYVFLATENGLYYINKSADKWIKIHLGDNKPIKKIIKKDEDNLFIFSDSNIYLLDIKNDFSVKKITPQKNGKRIITAVELFFHLHDGSAWGIIGRLLFDLGGLAIIFLSLSAFYIWFIPKKIKKRKYPPRHFVPPLHGGDFKTANPVLSKKGKSALKRDRKLFRFFYQYHKKIGIYSLAVVIIISFTAIFMRPPFIVAITDSYLSRYLYPAPVSENRWYERIENGLYDKSRDVLMIQTSEFLWQWDIKNDDYSKKAVKSKQNWPLFVMGATYLETDKDNNYIMGSFSGFYKYYPDTDKYENLVKTADKYNRIKPDKNAMVAGAFKYNNNFYIATHLQGLKNLNGESVKLFKQPKIMNEIKMPLWNWNFELHNGRILKFIIGKYYILLVPFSALLFFLVILSGLYDWIFIIRRK